MDPSRHLHPEQPSGWVIRFGALIRAGGTVLDLACGAGRHARWLAARGWRVEAVDRDGASLASLYHADGIEPLCVDLEGAPWPYPGRTWDGIVVTNYLHRPLFPLLQAGLNRGGVLVYETFMIGNERFGRPSNPAFLLRPKELLETFGRELSIVAFEQGEIAAPKPAVVQRLCAVRAPDATRLMLPECPVPGA